MIMSRKSTLLFTLLVSGLVADLAAEEVDGILAEVGYTGEFLTLALDDSLRYQPLFLDNLDITLTFDTEALGLWKGGTGFIYFISNTGDDPSEFVGDMQVTSNIEASNSQQLYEFWYNHAIGNWNVLLGFHDLNSEFYTSEVAGLFTNSSFGIGADVAANAPVSIFNAAGLGLRVMYSPDEHLSILGAVYDGDPGEPEDNPYDVRVDWDKDQGLMSIFETQIYGPTPQGRDFGNIYRLGSWFHSGLFDVSGYDSTGNPLEPRYGNYGAYFSIDQWLSSSLVSFIHGGLAAKDRSAVPIYFGAGLNYSPQSMKDVFGIAGAFANCKEEGGWEIALELIWQTPLTDFLTFQPDLQYIIRPCGNLDKKGVLIAGFRIMINR